MPNVRIEVKKSWPSGKQQQFMEAVHAAMVATLRIPPHDKLIRFVEHRPEHFATPPGTTENFTLVEITLFSGRSLEVKRRLYQAIVSRFVGLGVEPADTRIVLHEVSMENWGIRGGVPASEVDLGFKIDV
jgi:phenylpyruvate tautomerase PptA (4-oxalocrotonate tautomerase family)